MNDKGAIESFPNAPTQLLESGSSGLNARPTEYRVIKRTSMILRVARKKAKNPAMAAVGARLRRAPLGNHVPRRGALCAPTGAKSNHSLFESPACEFPPKWNCIRGRRRSGRIKWLKLLGRRGGIHSQYKKRHHQRNSLRIHTLRRSTPSDHTMREIKCYFLDVTRTDRRYPEWKRESYRVFWSRNRQEVLRHFHHIPSSSVSFGLRKYTNPAQKHASVHQVASRAPIPSRFGPKQRHRAHPQSKRGYPLFRIPLLPMQ